eukprot:638098-Prorocentrum_minimum.AAC.2
MTKKELRSGRNRRPPHQPHLYQLNERSLLSSSVATPSKTDPIAEQATAAETILARLVAATVALLDRPVAIWQTQRLHYDYLLLGDEHLSA